jgi:predicted HTH domain antitoxin
MQKIMVDFPSDILLTLNSSEYELKKDIKLSLAIQMYLKEKVTIGKAAQIAGVSKFQFETILTENKIPISNLDFDDISNDISKLK